MKRPAILFLIAFAQTLMASGQSPIAAFHTTYLSSNIPKTYSATPATGSSSFNSCSSTNFSYNFNTGSSNLLKLLDLISNGKNYYITNSATSIVKLRRVNNSSVTGKRSVLSMESTLSSTTSCPSSGQINLITPYSDAMETMLNSNYLNQGTDNIFTNSGNGDGNNNNIERVDIIFSSGMASAIASDAGFAIFDRGTNNGHDGFRIAAITSLDENGDPASFGPLMTCVKGNGSSNGSWGHPSTANGNKTFAEYVLRKDEWETQLRVSAAINQQVGGVFFSFADLGIANNQKIYGYVVLSTDGLANPSSAQLLDINDASVYPTNTTESTGGLDMMAVNAVFQTSSNPLAVRKAELHATRLDEKVLLKWHVKDVDVNTAISIERSYNGSDFAAIYQVPNSHRSSGSFSEAEVQTAYYRLKINRPVLGSHYSNIVATPAGDSKIIVYPTLLRQGQSLTFKGIPKGHYQLLLTSLNGVQQAIDVVVATPTALVVIAGQQLKGLVYLCLRNEDAKTFFSAAVLIE